MRRLVLVLVLCGFAVAAGIAGAREPSASTHVEAAAQTPPKLGMLKSRLVRIDPRTLTVLPGRGLAVGTHGSAWSFSHDGSRVALGGEVDYAPSLLVADTRQLRALGHVLLAKSGWVRATTWLRDGRVAAVVSVFDGGSVRTDVVTVDGRGRKVVHRQSFSGQILRVSRASGGLIVLRAAAESLAPARLTVVDANGRATDVLVRGILAGSERRDGRGGADFAQREPALAVDPAGRKAFVVDAIGGVGEIDLVTGKIAYHRLSRPKSFFARVHSWLDESAEAKSFEGPSRVARWLGNGLIGLSGGDYSVTGKQLRYRPVGLELVDTRTWTVRTLGEGTDAVWPAGSWLLAATTTSSGEVVQASPPGVIAYDADGHERWRLFDGSHAWLVYADAERAYVWVDKGASVVDIASGRVVERRSAIAWPLVAPGAPTEN